MKSILYYFLIFFIYSTLGWIVESIYVSITKKKIINRGFLIGPYCPIYGCGSLIIITYIYQYKENPITIFLLSTIMCTTLEYITSYLMEKIYKTRWWDYSDKSFNINGRVCGENALLFGIGSLYITYIQQPIIHYIITKTNNIIILSLSIIFLIIFIIDIIISCKIVNKLKKNLSNIELRKDSTQEIKKIVQETLEKSTTKKTTLLEKRLIKAYPNIDLKPFIQLKDKGTKKIKKIIKKGLKK